MIEALVLDTDLDAQVGGDLIAAAERDLRVGLAGEAAGSLSVIGAFGETDGAEPGTGLIVLGGRPSCNRPDHSCVTPNNCNAAGSCLEPGTIR